MVAMLRASSPWAHLPIFELSELPKTVTTYGGPKDPFLKVVDSYVIDGDGNVSVERQVFARGYVDQIDVAVSVSV